MNGYWEAPSWEEIPMMEGFFFEINNSLSTTIIGIGTGDFHMAARHMRRVKALIRPSGIFDEIRPMDEMYGTSEKFIKNAVLSRCDKIIKNLENAISGKKLDLKNVLIELGSLVHIINEYYMYAKTKVCFAGSYKPAFDIFEREGIP